MEKNTLLSIPLRQEDINLITFALRRVKGDILKYEADNLMAYINFVNLDLIAEMKEQDKITV